MKYIGIALSVFILFIVACDKTEATDKTPAELLEGKWNVESTELLGATVPGDGSYLIFDVCTDTICTGTDFRGTDTTTGSFTYTLNVSADSLLIEDTTSLGGGYGYDWDIEKLTETDLKMNTTTFLFGTFKIDMKKDQ